MAKKSSNNGKNNKKNNIESNKSKKSSISKNDISTKNKSNISNQEKIKQDILKQYGLSEEYEPNEEQQQNQEVLQTLKENEKPKGYVYCAADDEGWNKPKQLAKNFMYGIFMGASDAVPGYSGGTTLSLIGFYERLVKNFKRIFKPDVGKYFWKYLIWFLPFAISWIGVLIGAMFIVREAGKNDAGVALVFLFGSFAFFSIPLFYLMNKDKILDFREIRKPKNKKSNIISITAITIGFILVITFGIIARFVATSQIRLADGSEKEVVGVTFGKQEFDITSLTNGDTATTVLPLLLFSFLAGFVMLIPGLSGGLVLFMSNWYPKISGMITNIITGSPNAAECVPFIVVVIIGMIIGVIISSIVIDMVYTKFPNFFYNLSFGFVIGSFLAIFISLSSYDYGFLSTNSSTLGLSIGMIFLAIALNIVIFIVLNETNKISFPKLKIFNKSAKQAN